MNDLKSITKLVQLTKLEKSIENLTNKVPKELQYEFLDLITSLFEDVEYKINNFLEEKGVNKSENIKK